MRRYSPNVKHPEMTARIAAHGLADVKVRDFTEGTFATGWWGDRLVCLAVCKGQYEVVAVHDLGEQNYEQGRLL